MDSTAQTGYECFEELISQLRVEGHAKTADELDFILHRIAWTTSSELIGELGSALRAFERSAPKTSPVLRQQFNSCLRLVRRVWPEIK